MKQASIAEFIEINRKCEILLKGILEREESESMTATTSNDTTRRINIDTISGPQISQEELTQKYTQAMFERRKEITVKLFDEFLYRPFILSRINPCENSCENHSKTNKRTCAISI